MTRESARSGPAPTGSPLAGVVTAERFDAVLFDLDGVLTETATVHAACWKQVFDGFLARWGSRRGERLAPFDVVGDYPRHVDGKPRYDGVRDFLASRHITLPEGTPDSPPEEESVHGIGNAKDLLVQETLRTEGVDPFPGSVAWLRQLRAAGIRTAVVSASAHCAEVLEAARIADLFDARVDGVVAARRALAGKPAPDTFLAAATDLGVAPARAVVVEDALAGVEAGRAGGFGLVIGVDRTGHPDALRAHGADLVVRDLAELVDPSGPIDPTDRVGPGLPG